MKALELLLSLERPTSKAMMYSEWDTPPEIIIELLPGASFSVEEKDSQI
jgi:hypothetical protein